MACSYLLSFTLLLLSCLTVSYAQSISTSTPVPPLQWINLTRLLTGAAPPPLRDAVVGYDETSRSLIIFGGESSGGFVQSQTYLLNLESLTWQAPSPPANLQRTPSPRSAAIGGIDFAASNRHGFVVIGGKGSDGGALSDVWEYDFINQFWAPVTLSPGGPSARWGSSGGIDFRSTPIQDPIVPGPNNTFYLAGGFNGTTSSPLSDVWMLNISGTLSSNLPNDTTGSWDSLTIGNLPSKVDQAGTVILQQIIAAGGCNTTSLTNNSCAQQDSYVIDTQRRREISPSACPAPRLSPTLVPNTNSFSTSFASQVFLLLGTFNTSLWQDDGGLDQGEVAVLDINAGTWSRILPSGDPGTSGKPTFPTPREGASAFSYPMALVGSGSRNTSSDTIVFGGQDASGKYLSDVWLLRAYTGTITSSNQKWSGFGSGELQSGPNANGAGVTVKYMSTCASAINSPASSSTASSSNLPSSNLPSPTPSSSPNSFSVQPYDTSILHKLFAPLSVALFLPALFLFRLASPIFNPSHSPERYIGWTYAAILLAVIAYGFGFVGIATSFTTISLTGPLAKRAFSSNLALKTGHGKAGLAFFAGLYGLVPLLMILSLYFGRSRDPIGDDTSEQADEPREHINLVDAGEKLDTQRGRIRSAPQSVHDPSPPSSPRPRTHSWGPSSLWRRSREGRLSSDSESVSSAGPQRGFEVVNRPSRTRQASGSWLAVPSAEGLQGVMPRNLSDLDWLQRRRTLNAVGELDYALSQANRPLPSTPHTTDALIMTPMLTKPALEPKMPHAFEIILRLLLHAFVLGLCAISLVELWSRAPRATFAVFLAWTLTFYIFLFAFSWYGKPEKSTLTLMIARLRANPQPVHHPSISPSPQPLAIDHQFPFPTEPRGPYVHHQPPYRTAMSDTSYSHGGPRSVETDDDDADDDEDTRQRRIEEEMGRRDVSIVTVPKRKLWIANPS